MAALAPPGKILCVGRNYRDHARELGNEPPAEPLFFLKPATALLESGRPILLPPGVGRVDFEGEVAFVIGREARHVPERQALDVLSHVLPLNDVTARELQRRDGQWTRAKGFDTFCPVGEPVPLAELPGWDQDPQAAVAALRIESRVNGEIRQEGGLEDLIFPVPVLIAWISRVMTLQPGDVVATGTPAGVGPLAPGDEVEIRISGVGAVQNPVRAGEGVPWSPPAQAPPGA